MPTCNCNDWWMLFLVQKSYNVLLETYMINLTIVILIIKCDFRDFAVSFWKWSCRNEGWQYSRGHSFHSWFTIYVSFCDRSLAWIFAKWFCGYVYNSSFALLDLNQTAQNFNYRHSHKIADRDRNIQVISNVNNLQKLRCLLVENSNKCPGSNLTCFNGMGRN